MRLLVVEDEHRIANTIKKGFEQERYAVDVAYIGVFGKENSDGSITAQNIQFNPQFRAGPANVSQ